MSKAQSGHGALIAMELDPVATPGVFTTIAEIIGDVKWPALSRPEVECTTHNDNIDQWQTVGVLTRGPMSFGVNFIFNEGTHDHLTGLIYAVANNQQRGFRLRGPGGAPNVDEWICSGFVQNVDETSGAKDVRKANVILRFTKAMKIDGVTFQ